MNTAKDDRASILRALSERLPGVRTRYGVKTLALFGSAARDELGPQSDIDVLVKFDGPATFVHALL